MFYKGKHERPLPNAVRNTIDASLAFPTFLGTLVAGTVLAVSAHGIIHNDVSETPANFSRVGDVKADKLVNCQADPTDTAYLYFAPQQSDAVIFGSVERQQQNYLQGNMYPVLSDAVELSANGMSLQVTPLHGEPEVIKFTPDATHHMTTLADGSLVSFGPAQESATAEPRLVAAIACPEAVPQVG